MDLLRGSLNDLLAWNKYHSALIATYTFDPLFLKKIFIPTLQSKRIRNISILADYREIARSFTDKGNLAAMMEVSYLLVPARASTLFHPKVMLFTGPKQGLCLIGSGNLTHSGMGGNDELWGAFHITDENRQHVHIFRFVWQFLQIHSPVLTGAGEEKKKDWIVAHTPWLNEVVSETDDGNHEAIVLAATEELTIWDQVRDRLADKKMTEAVVASPFYDNKGLVFRKLRETFPDIAISMIYDGQGTIPEVSEGLNELSCFCWQYIAEKGEKGGSGRHLHAKYLLLKDSDFNEYLLFGSANATDSALGLDRKPAHCNVELVVLGRRSNSGLSRLLGVNLEAISAQRVHEAKVENKHLDEPQYEAPKDNVRIIYAEQKANIVNVVFSRRPDQQVTELKIVDSDGKSISGSKINKEKELVWEATLPVDVKSGHVPKVTVVSIADGYPQMPVYHHKSLSLSNPNPRLEILRSTLSDILVGDFGSLGQQLMKVFNQITRDDERHQQNREVGTSSSRERQDEEPQSDEFIDKDRFRDKKIHPGRSAGDTSELDSLMAIIRALSRIQFKQEDSGASGESQSQDGSVEQDANDVEAKGFDEERIIHSLSNHESRIHVYRLLLRRSLNHFKKFVEAHKKNDPQKPAVIDEFFVGGWLLIANVALNLIIHEGKMAAPPGDDNDRTGNLDGKTTILPYKSKNGLSIHEVIHSLIPRIRGCINKDRIDLRNMLDKQERMEGAGTMVLLLCFRHWGTSEQHVFQKIFFGMIETFRIENEVEVREFRMYLFDLVGKMNLQTLRENDWRYFSNFLKSFDVIKRLMPS